MNNSNGVELVRKYSTKNSFTGITSLFGGLFYLKFSSGKEQKWSSTKPSKSTNQNSRLESEHFTTA